MVSIPASLRYFKSVSTHLLPQLLRGAVIDRPANLIPPDIRIGKEPLIYWRRGCQRQHDGPQRAQLVVHLAPFGQVLGLERDLQAAAAHAKGHGIHVDEVIGGGAVADIGVLGPLVQVVVNGRVPPRPGGILVPEDWHVHLHFPATPGTDVGRERGKADVGVCDLVRDKLGSQFGARDWVSGVGEDAWATKPGECREGDWIFIGQHMVFCDTPPTLC